MFLYPDQKTDRKKIFKEIFGVDTKQRLSKMANVTKWRNHKTANVTKRRITKLQLLQNDDCYKKATVTILKIF